MNVCIVTENRNIQKEWHKATKPFKKKLTKERRKTNLFVPKLSKKRRQTKVFVPQPLKDRKKN
jgi:hypothetical protein